ncbi:MAG: hypothetical protein BWZ10_01795 [candidate division BRC1 bacterium ADurb.BinA364]|nr:MAG: hypothetical protein BWZ10_01795 [candidate division BRC1 bacterium ADurb.BinA364]
MFIDTDRDGVNENIDDLPNWAEGIHLHLGVLGHFWSKPDHPDRGGVFGTTWEKAWWGAASLRPGGYVHEYRLKMSEFDTENGPGFTPLKPGDMIGLNVLANDDDEHNPPNENDRREDQVTWWGAEAAGYDAFKFAQTWPRALLSPDIQRNEAGASWARYR